MINTKKKLEGTVPKTEKVKAKIERKFLKQKEKPKGRKREKKIQSKAAPKERK